MKLDKAFRNTPPEVHYAIERAFQRGEAEMKKRHKIALALSMAACMAAMVAAALAVNGAPRRESRAVPLSETGKRMEAGDATVYFTSEGKYYHDIDDCSGMTGARAGTEREAWRLDKRPCPVCLGGETVGGTAEEAADTTEVPAAGSAGTAAPVGEATMTPDPTAEPTATMTPEPTPTPTAVPEEAEAFEEAGASAGLPVYYTAGGNYYHGIEDCSGMEGASAHTLAEAETAGKQRCPVCQPLGEAPHMDLFRKAFGLEIGDVWPGHSYHHLADMWFRSGYDGERFWVLGRTIGDVYYWVYGVGYTAAGDGAVRLSLSDSICPGVLERVRDGAPNPVSAILGADLDALARANGRNFPGLKDLPCAKLDVTFEKSGNMKAISLLLSESDDPGDEGVGYTAEWSAIDGGFQLERIVDGSGGTPDWIVPAGLVTVTG